MVQKINDVFRQDIQGIRALAVLSVIIYHFYPTILQGGFVGVDIFFVISGYLISKIVFRKLDEGSFSITNFYANRALRLVPALLVVLTFILFLGWIFLLPREYKALASESLFGALFTSNFYFLFNTGYFDTSAYTKPLLNLWSLGIEVQFYLLWPAFLILTPKRQPLRIIAILLMFTVSIMLCFYFLKKIPLQSFYFPFTRIWEFSAGAFCAVTLNFDKLIKSNISQNSIKLKISFALANQLIPVLGLIMIFIALFKTPTFSYPNFWGLLPVTGASILLLSKESFLNRNILSSRVLVYIGKISYPLYLWHWPLLSIALIVNDNILSNESRAIIIFLSIALSIATHELIETKFTKRQPTRQLGFAFFLYLVAIISTCTLIYLNNGYKNRFDTSTVLTDELLNPHGNFSGKSNYFQANIALCETFDGKCNQKGEKPTIAFIGDSHMGVFMNAINKNISNSHIVIQQTLCLPFATKEFLDFNNCKAKQLSVINYLNKNVEIDTVVLSGFYEFLSTSTFTETGTNWRIAGVDIKKPYSIPSFIENADIFLKKIKRDNRRIIIIGNVPTLNFDIRRCVKFHPLKWEESSAVNCSIDYMQHIRNTSYVTNALQIILKQNPDVIYYDISRFLCDDERCYAMDNDIPIYYNGDHLNSHGADIIFRHILENLKLNGPVNSETKLK